MPKPRPSAPAGEPRLRRRLLWFGGLWLAGLLTLSVVTALLRWLIP